MTVFQLQRSQEFFGIEIVSYTDVVDTTNKPIIFNDTFATFEPRRGLCLNSIELRYAL